MKSTTLTLTTPDGRQLCIEQAGPQDGIPVIVHSGTPDSRLLHTGWIDDALARGIHLIGYDRPGYGGSTSQPGRRVADAAADVRCIADTLGLKRITVWGASGGGPHALACAALLPDLVAAIAILASVAPYPADGLDWMAGMGEDNINEFSAALTSREALQQFVEASASGIQSATPEELVQALRTLLSPVDSAVFTDEYGEFVVQRAREAIEQRRDGWVDDDLAFTQPWGFELNQIHVPVLLMQGGQDQMVPFSHGEWLASKIPGVEARMLPEEGHLTLAARRIPEVHAWLLSKIGPAA